MKKFNAGTLALLGIFLLAFVVQVTGDAGDGLQAIKKQIANYEASVRLNQSFISINQSLLQRQISNTQTLAGSYQRQLDQLPRNLVNNVNAVNRQLAATNTACRKEQQANSAEIARISREFDALIEYQVLQKQIDPARSVVINREISRLENLKNRQLATCRNRETAIAERMQLAKDNNARQVYQLKKSHMASRSALLNRIQSVWAGLNASIKSINKIVSRLQEQIERLSASIRDLEKKLAVITGGTGNSGSGADSTSGQTSRRLNGNLVCLETYNSVQPVFTGQQLTFSLENLCEVTTSATGTRLVALAPAKVASWTWKAESGAFDARRSLESSLPVNRNIWNAADRAGWYSIECGIDVYGNGRLVATFSHRLYVNQKTVVQPPASFSLNIIGQSPIPGSLNARRQVEFSQTFTADTALTSTLTWLATPGKLEVNGKTAKWSLTCALDAIPDTVTITCLSNFNSRNYRCEKKFDLSKKAAEDEKDPATAAKNADTEKLLGYFAKLGIKIDNNLGPNGMPEFWSREQLYYAWKTVNSLPEHFAASLKTLKRVASLPGNSMVLGYVYGGVPTVYMCNLSTGGSRFETTLVHEMAHVWYFDKANQEIKNAWQNTFWKDGKLATAIKEPPVSAYGHSNVHEDFAEACKIYWTDGPKMAKTNPLRYKFLHEQVFKMQYVAPNQYSKEKIYQP
ncbi:MAG TPA: hypothetical protein PKM56_07160 [Candidatus Rifleibacterium sp.]|nr:hypothetical protein [Candidatus Rifleibacterium sp.]